MMTIRQLRIYAILIRLQEMERERQQKIRERFLTPFLPEPIQYKMMPRHENFSNLYDKNGKLFDPPKSKYHK